MPTQSRAIVQITARNGIGTNTPTSNAAWGIHHANKLLDVLASDPDRLDFRLPVLHGRASLAAVTRPGPDFFTESFGISLKKERRHRLVAALRCHRDIETDLAEKALRQRHVRRRVQNRVHDLAVADLHRWLALRDATLTPVNIPSRSAGALKG